MKRSLVLAVRVVDGRPDRLAHSITIWATQTSNLRDLCKPANTITQSPPRGMRLQIPAKDIGLHVSLAQAMPQTTLMPRISKQEMEQLLSRAMMGVSMGTRERGGKTIIGIETGDDHPPIDRPAPRMTHMTGNLQNMTPSTTPTLPPTPRTVTLIPISPSPNVHVAPRSTPVLPNRSQHHLQLTPILRRV